MTWDTATIGALSLLAVAIITAFGAQAERIIRALRAQTDVIAQGNSDSATANVTKIQQSSALIAATGGTPPPVPTAVFAAAQQWAPAVAGAEPTAVELAQRIAVLEAAILIPPPR